MKTQLKWKKSNNIMTHPFIFPYSIHAKVQSLRNSQKNFLKCTVKHPKVLGEKSVSEAQYRIAYKVRLRIYIWSQTLKCLQQNCSRCM